MIRIHSYDTNTVLGTINPLTCTVTQQKNTYAVAKIKMTTAEYSANKDILILKNTLAIEMQNCTEMFTIVNLDCDKQYCTIEATQICYGTDKVICTLWNYEKERVWVLYELIMELYSSITTTYQNIKWFNNAVGDSSSANPTTYQPWIYVIDDDGNRAENEYPSVMYDPQWYQTITNLDFFGKTLEEIIHTIENETNLYMWYLDNRIYFSFMPPSDFFAWKYDNSSNIEKARKRYADSKDYTVLNWYTGNNCQSFQYKLEADNFVGSIMPNYTIELDNRAEKQTSDTVLWIEEENAPYYEDNAVFQTLYGDDACKRYMISRNYRSEIEWNRKIDMWVNVYWVPQGANNRQIRFEKEYTSKHSESTIPTLEVPIYNITKKQIATASGFTWNAGHTEASTTILDPDTSEVIGSAYIYPVSGEENKFTLRCNLLMERWGGVNFNFAPSSIQWQRQIAVATKPEKELRLYNVFGEEFGTVDFSKMTEADSGDPSLTTVPIWEIKYTDKDENLIIRGHCWFKMQQMYETYRENFLSDIITQTQLDVNSYDWQMLSSLKIELIPQDIRNVILPHDNIPVYVREFEKKIDFDIDSITYDCINRKYTDIQTGFKQSTLRELGLQLAEIKRNL